MEIKTQVVRTTSARNAHGVKVKRCCARCQHKCVENDGTRVCAAVMLKVQQNFKCRKWQISDGLNHAGCGGGNVKCKEYLAYVQEIRSTESDDIQYGMITERERKTLEEIRQLFTEKFGSIYLTEC